MKYLLIFTISTIVSANSVERFECKGTSGIDNPTHSTAVFYLNTKNSNLKVLNEGSNYSLSISSTPTIYEFKTAYTYEKTFSIFAQADNFTMPISLTMVMDQSGTPTSYYAIWWNTGFSTRFKGSCKKTL